MKKALVLILVITGLRLVNLTQTPIFGDEAAYCWSGYQMAHQGVKITWEELVNQDHIAPGLSLVQGGLVKLLPQVSPIWLCRSVSVIAAGITGGLIFWLAKSLSSSWQVRWGAVLFWMINPFNFFNDRTGLQEPLLNLFSVMLAVLAWWGISRKQWLGWVGAGGALILATLTKLTSLMLVPGWVSWLVLEKRLNLKPRLLLSGGLIMVSFILVWWIKQFTNLWSIFGYHSYAGINLIGLVNRGVTNLRLTGSWYNQYLSPGFWLVATLGLVKMIRSGQWPVGLIMGPILASYILLADSYFPRMLLVTLPVWAIIVGYGLVNRIGVLVFGLMLVIFGINDIKIIARPAEARLAREDYFQFYQDWTSGQGIKQSVEAVLSQPEINTVIVPADLETSFRLQLVAANPKWPGEIVIAENVDGLGGISNEAKVYRLVLPSYQRTGGP